MFFQLFFMIFVDLFVLMKNKQVSIKWFGCLPVFVVCSAQLTDDDLRIIGIGCFDLNGILQFFLVSPHLSLPPFPMAKGGRPIAIHFHFCRP